MATTLGYEAEFKAFLARIEANKTRKRIDNSKLRAGSPMHYDCKSCRDDMERDEDDFGPKEEHCALCRTMKEAGVLEDFIARAAEVAA